MAPVGTPELVATLLGQSPEDPALVGELLRAAERRLTRRIPDLRDRVEASDDFAADVAFVEASAAVRVLRNPDGYRSETAGGVSYALDTRAAAGFLTILSEEWAALGIMSAGRAGTIAPSFTEPTMRLFGDPTWP